MITQNEARRIITESALDFPVSSCRACGKLCEHVYCSNLCRYYALPFRAWDGEGITIDTGHLFTILACNDDDPLICADGITTLDAFEYLTRYREKTINIWYYFDYDVNCILRDIPLYPYLDELARRGKTMWRGWKIRYIPNKIFSIKRGTFKFNSYDVSGFFQTSFVKACKSNGLDPASIELGKASRAKFSEWKTEDVVAYNAEELRLLVALATKLRTALKYHAPQKMWYGPGAVASQWLKTKNIIPRRERNWPPEMNDSIMRAYFGGRIDVREIGESSLHCYDIASAYPYAMTHIVSVENWDRLEYCSDQFIRENPMSLHLVAWDVPSAIPWGPFPWRSPHGEILYPPLGMGWYYGCEVNAAKKAFAYLPAESIQVLESWIPVSSGKISYPLRHGVRHAYDVRAKMKRDGDQSQIAYKLILNSLYGKFAQKRASHIEPRYQNYLWAGFITAFTRSMLLEIIAKDSENVIACATDSVFTRNALDLHTSDALGEWQYEGYAPTLTVMPGVYARFCGEKVQKYRQRGFAVPLNYGALLRSWGCGTQLNTDGSSDTVSVVKKFVTFRQAIAQHRKQWGYFEEETKSLHDVSILGFGKRFPDISNLMEDGWMTRRMFATHKPAAQTMSREYTIPDYDDEVNKDEIILL